MRFFFFLTGLVDSHETTHSAVYFYSTNDINQEIFAFGSIRCTDAEAFLLRT